jgi:phage gp46-like protein
MSDVALRWLDTEGAADVAVESNDLARDDGLRTAVLLSLFTDRRADPGEKLPDGETDRRGWWGDSVPTVEGDKIGSRLWLVARERQSTAVLERIESYAAEALQWLLDDKVAERIEVTGSIPRPGMWGLEVAIYRPHRADPTRFRFDRIWRAEED